MDSPELFIVRVLKAMVEIAALSLLAQGVIAVLSGNLRQQNVFHRLFQVVTAPIIKIMRAITPGFIADRYLGLVGFFILFWLWITLVVAKGYLCHTQQLACIPA